jgi:hypothetical protein
MMDTTFRELRGVAADRSTMWFRGSLRSHLDHREGGWRGPGEGPP